MHSSDTVAGTTICSAPSRIAVSTSLPCSRCQLMFSIVTVASSTRMPTASANPPSVITLIVSPSTERAVSERSMASGIETVMISVERQLPRNSRIISPGQRRGDNASRITLRHRVRHEDRLIADRAQIEARRQRLARSLGSSALMPAMISSVEAAPDLMTDSKTAFLPSTCTTLVCGGLPSCTIGDVAHVNDRAVDGLDRQIVEGARWRLGESVQIDRVFELADLLRPDRRDQILDRQRVDDVVARRCRRCAAPAD